MSSQAFRSPDSSSAADSEVTSLYWRLLDCWNKRSAVDMAKLFEENGNAVGFDGSPLNGQEEIESELSRIFADHQTASYVGKIREVRFLNPEVALLRAVAGMVPPGASDINPAVNAIQSLVCVRHTGENIWRIALFQNTPAQFHGRPELAQQLTEELRQLL